MLSAWTGHEVSQSDMVEDLDIWTHLEPRDTNKKLSVVEPPSVKSSVDTFSVHGSYVWFGDS